MISLEFLGAVGAAGSGGGQSGGDLMTTAGKSQFLKFFYDIGTIVV